MKTMDKVKANDRQVAAFCRTLVNRWSELTFNRCMHPEEVKGNIDKRMATFRAEHDLTDEQIRWVCNTLDILR